MTASIDAKVLGLFDLSGKVALVTGGSRGIGLMIASGLLRAGARVYVTSRKIEACKASVKALAVHGDAVALPCDVADVAAIGALAARLAEFETKLDILVNNAGATWGQPLEAFTEGGWDKVMDLNLKSPFFLIQALIPLLRAAATSADPARVLNVGSVDGIVTSRFDNFSYAASKAGLHHLTRILAARLACENINVNAIAPGPFDTRMIAFALDTDRTAVESMTAIKRLGAPDDIAGAAIFLTSRASAYVTGALIPVDGGMSVVSH